MKERAKRYAKALVAAATSGVGTAVAVALAGPGSTDAETYLSAVIVAFLVGTATALKRNAPPA